MTHPSSAAAAGPSQSLAQLVVKRGVGLGGLAAPQQDEALLWVWAGLPAGCFTEAEFNTLLKQQLSGPAAFLQTDHVELRRWLVDKRLVQRDGYGRAYERVPVDAVPDPLRAQARTLQGWDTTQWTQAQRDAREAARAARRSAWEARQGGPAPGGPP